LGADLIILGCKKHFFSPYKFGRSAKSRGRWMARGCWTAPVACN
jgi:hypothetical protein